jgi:hypothetical protein
MREEDLLGPHPKTQSTIESCLAAVRAQEKTLVFVERTETGRAIRDELVRALDRQRDQAAYRRLQSPERFGWPSLRENYLHSLYPEVFGAPPVGAGGKLTPLRRLKTHPSEDVGGASVGLMSLARS